MDEKSLNTNGSSKGDQQLEQRPVFSRLSKKVPKDIFLFFVEQVTGAQAPETCPDSCVIENPIRAVPP